MKRLKILAVLIIVSMSVSLAQKTSDSYFGVSASVIKSPVGAIPLPGIQFGTKVADNLEFRASFENLTPLNSNA